MNPAASDQPSWLAQAFQTLPLSNADGGLYGSCKMCNPYICKVSGSRRMSLNLHCVHMYIFWLMAHANERH